MEVNSIFAEARECKQVVSLPLRRTKAGKDAFFSLFKCENCGECCTTGFEYIEFSKREFEQVKTLLPKGGRSKFKKVGKKYRMSYPCAFFSKKRRCTIYDKRPTGCRNHPVGYFIENAPNNLAFDARCPQAYKVAKAIYEFAAEEARNTTVTRRMEVVKQ